MKVTLCIRDENYSPIEKIEYTGKLALYDAIKHALKYLSFREILKLLSEV